jgi:hypothetical protein
MSKRPWFFFVLIAGFIILVGLACSAGADTAPTLEPTDEPVVLPTSEPEPTAELPKPALPTQGAAPAGPAPFEIDSNVYEHPSGIFSFNPPVGWSMDESDSDLLMVAPDNTGSLYLSATNTGVELDMESLDNFIQAREANFFSGRDEYTQQDYQIYEDATAVTKKTFLFDNIPQYVFTIYLARGPAVFAFDFWADEDLAEAYNQPFLDVANTIIYDGNMAANLPLYNYVYTYSDPNGLFEFEVPSSWTYAYDEGENVYTDTFTSPDNHAVIQNITYDDGTEISKSVAGQFALNLLNMVYTDGANDIKITGDKVQPDGSERLTWESRSGGFSGISFFETRGTTFLMLSWLADSGFEEVYGPVFDGTLASYTVP